MTMKGRMSAKLALFQWISLIVNCGLVLGSFNCNCYWNSPCMYTLFGTVTPYDTVRGDLRDQVEDGGCEVLSIWSLHRHGNRNPSADVTRDISALQDKIKKLLQNPSAHRRQNNITCAQDMDDLMNWRWNSTLENTTSYLTGIGYEEVYALIGRRMRIRYEKFLKSVDKVYFRATNVQRTTTSLAAFAHGLSEGIAANFSMFIHPPLERDDLLLPYENCKRYQHEVIGGQLLADELAAYDSSPYYLAIRDSVQSKFPVAYELTSTDIFTMYQLCRFDRSGSEKLRSPWCSFFYPSDLMKLEFRDDLRHYYRNGYGSGINLQLGALPLKDLYGHFVNVIEGRGKALVSYFTHDTMLDMVFSALGLFKESEPLRGSVWEVKEYEERSWRTSKLAAFATNFIAVLSRFLKSVDKVYFRATNEQRTTTSLAALAHGLSEGTAVNFSMFIHPPLERDDLLRPYENCKRYQHEVIGGQLLADELAAYDSSPYYLAVNLKLGSLPLKDLYGHFVNVTEGRGKTLVSYFTHDTMLDMVFSALGLFKESEPLRGLGSVWKFWNFEDRPWKTSELAAFATNFIAVLSRCDESDGQTYRVRLFINEKPTPLCPEDGCTWQQFVDIFRVFSGADLDFCDNWSESDTAAFLTGRTNTNNELATILFVFIIVFCIL